MGWAKVGTGATLAAIGGLAARYAVQRERLERSWLRAVGPKLSAIGEVEHLSILPLVERLVPDGDLEGEPGVAYLVRADGTTLSSTRASIRAIARSRRSCTMRRPSGSTCSRSTGS